MYAVLKWQPSHAAVVGMWVAPFGNALTDAYVPL
jgi:hypothetical protein